MTDESRAASAGVAAGVLVILSGLVAQTLPFTAGDAGVDLLDYYLLVLVVAVLLVAPVRPSRWPISTRRAAAVGAAWLVIGLPAPLWFITTQLVLLSTVLAGPLALLGAGVAFLRTRPGRA